ncbi:2338_t:CDS:10 [Entrophospora sp. SA101]|nr:2338_t:CDS:10 [Entrophospora sp. SA101]
MQNKSLTEIAAYTSAVVSEAYQIFDKTLRAGEDDNGNNSFYDMYDEDNVLVIVDGYETDLNDDELSDISCSWSVNDEDEPPPPYDSSWTIPATSTDKISTSPKKKSFSTPKNEDQSKGTSSISATPTHRRQIRVRRGRRLFRRRASSNELKSKQRTNDGDSECTNQDELLLRINQKLSDMIAQGKAALTSTVEVTEVEMMLIEEREREERIMRELGLQTPVGRHNRRFTNSSSSGYDSLSDSSSYSASETSYCEYGYGSNNRFASSTGYDPPLRYGSTAHYYSPITYGSPGIYSSSVGYNMLGSKSSNEFSSPIPSRYHEIPPSQIQSIQSIPQFAYNNLISNRYNVALSTVGGGDFGLSSGCFMNRYRANSQYGSDFFGLKENRLLVPPRFTGYPQCRVDVIKNQESYDASLSFMIIVTLISTLTTITLLIFDIGKLWDLHIIGEVIVVLLLSQGGRISSYWFYGIVGGYTFLVDVINISLSWPYDAIWFKCEYVREQTSTQLPIIDDEDMNMENSSSKMRKIQLHQK